MEWEFWVLQDFVLKAVEEDLTEWLKCDLILNRHRAGTVKQILDKVLKEFEKSQCISTGDFWEIKKKYSIEPNTIVREAQGMEKFDFITRNLWVWMLIPSQHILPAGKYFLDSDWIYEIAASLSEAKTKADCRRVN